MERRGGRLVVGGIRGFVFLMLGLWWGEVWFIGWVGDGVWFAVAAFVDSCRIWG